ncbi:GGDEF domain-containing protein [Thermomonas sp.]|uniref:GGDEF domain-containing protein n=1 Tax=Thermomonas sp. TaxID=1971895 RepID=UPI002488053A|nr:GGDEF domain-containing protein [Thermomonas sp.]MDI1254100.1 diguanylate cyclase [Thermomonas sp.]
MADDLHLSDEKTPRWEAVLQATRQSAWEYDACTGMIYHSPLWKALLGYAEEDIGNDLEEWIARIHPDDVDRVRTEMRQHLSGEFPFYDSVHRIRRKDGSYLWIQDRGQVMERDADGNPLRILGTRMEASKRQLFQEQLDQLAENVPGMLYQYQLNPDGSSHFPYASIGTYAIFGVSPEQLQANASLVFSRIHPDDLPGIKSIFQPTRQITAWKAEFRVTLPERGMRWLSGYAKPQRLESGAILWHGYIRDITSDKQRALKHQETERLLQHLMNEMPMGLSLVDASGHIYFRNRRFHKYFSFLDGKEPTLTNWWQMAYPDSAYRAQVISDWNYNIAEAARHGTEIQRKDYRMTMRDGTQRIMAIGGLAFGDHFMATFEDRTEQTAHSEQLLKMAYIDGLTGIANRRHFDETLQTEWRRCQRSGKSLSLLMIDIDYFKAYNDRYGHLHGDQCLQTVATALRARLDRAQDLVARFGGEEFICLLPECDLSGANRVAQALSLTVQELMIENHDSPVSRTLTISIGVATQMADDESTPEALLARADVNLYRAKQAGRNRVDDGTDVAADAKT